MADAAVPNTKDHRDDSALLQPIAEQKHLVDRLGLLKAIGSKDIGVVINLHAVAVDGQRVYLTVRGARHFQRSGIDRLQKRLFAQVEQQPALCRADKAELRRPVGEDIRNVPALHPCHEQFQGVGNVLLANLDAGVLLFVTRDHLAEPFHRLFPLLVKFDFRRLGDGGNRGGGPTYWR